ncbi:MAG: hypothetical protein ABL921_19215 [Pirellula sp.]
MLPTDYYAVGEQRVGSLGPEFLTLHSAWDSKDPAASSNWPNPVGSSVATLSTPPQVARIEALDRDFKFASLTQRQISIRHVSEGRFYSSLTYVSDYDW